MRLALSLVALAIAASPVGAADDLRPLYPEGTFAVLTIDFKEIAASPLGKKVVGADPPLTAARKLVGVFFGDEAARPPAAVRARLAGLANKVERVTFAVTAIGFERGPGEFVAFCEGPITEDDLEKGFAGYAKAVDGRFDAQKRGGRKLMTLSDAGPEAAAAVARKGLVVTAHGKNAADLLAAVLFKADGKGKPFVNVRLNAEVGRLKTADTPVWLVVEGSESDNKGGPITSRTAVATLALNGDADFRLVCDGESVLFLPSLALSVALERWKPPEQKVWGAFDSFKSERKGDVLTVAGSIPAKLLAEEYAEQK